MACHSHHDVHRHLPTGGWGWFWVGDADRGFGKNQPGGWIFNLLPYYENYNLYGQSSDGKPDQLSRKQRIGAAKVVQTPLSVINCPSRRGNRLYPMSTNEGGNFGYFNSITPDFAGRSDYAINSGHVYNEWPNYLLGQGPKSYVEARYWTANRYWGGEQSALFQSLPGGMRMTGVSYERSTVGFKQIADGLSRTYLIGEKHISASQYENGVNGGDNETWCTGFNNDNYRKTGRLANGKVVENSAIPDSTERAELTQGRFGSSHAGVWNVAFCDGSVRALAFDMDWRVHRDHGNRFDAGRVTPQAYYQSR